MTQRISVERKPAKRRHSPEILPLDPRAPTLPLDPRDLDIVRAKELANRTRRPAA